MVVEPVVPAGVVVDAAGAGGDERMMSQMDLLEQLLVVEQIDLAPVIVQEQRIHRQQEMSIQGLRPMNQPPRPVGKDLERTDRSIDRIR